MAGGMGSLPLLPLLEEDREGVGKGERGREEGREREGRKGGRQWWSVLQSVLWVAHWGTGKTTPRSRWSTA